MMYARPTPPAPHSPTARLLPCGSLLLLLLLALTSLSGCGRKEVRVIEVTAYCGCGECCGWERGSWWYLKLNVWDKYVSEGSRAGQPYTGKTASGKKPHPPRPGLFSVNSLTHPWMIPIRIVFFPWLLLPREGTIAADTRYYPFGTKMYIPGYGWGVVEDRGGAIKGPDKIDVFFRAHSATKRWGRKRIEVEIERRM